MILEALRKEISDTITKADFFKNVPVITHTQGAIDSMIAEALGRLGLCLVIEPVVGKVKHPDVGAYSMDLEILITVVENVLINRGGTADPSGETGTGKTADDCVEQLFSVFNPVDAAMKHESLCFLPMSFELINDAGGLLVFQVKGIAQGKWART